MKLFWKFFFSIMILTQCCFSVGGYQLVQYNFHKSLEREINYTSNENDNLYYLVYTSLNDYQIQSGDFIGDFNYISIALSYTDIYHNMLFEVLFNDKQLINNNFEFDIETTLDVQQREYQTIKENDKYYIFCSRKFKLNDNTYTVNNCRDITEIFNERNEQYQIYIFIMIIEFFVTAIIIYILCYYLLLPIKKLSLATKQLAIHNYDIELQTDRNDELGRLSQDFLSMSREIQDYIEKQELFIGNFTHELKTPLTSIIGYGDMLRSKRVNEEELILYSNKIVEEGKRLENISQKLMKLIVLKNHDFVFQTINTTEFFDSIYTTVLTILNDDQIHFDIEEHYISIEPDLMKTAILNLIDNAKNNTGENKKITVRFYKKDYYFIEVNDNGKGMSKEDIIKVTEAFYMVDKSRTRAHGGAGLGLSLVKSIVDLHKGELIINSELGSGTHIIIKLEDRCND